MNIARTVILSSKLPRNTWNEAVSYATFVKNQLPHSSLPEKKSSLQVAKPNVNIQAERALLCTFGEPIWAFNYIVKDKLKARAFEA